MQIHDLNTKALTNPAYVAFDDGSDTYKADFKAEIDNAAADAVADADLTDNTVAFTSGDAASPTSWTAVSVLTSGLTIKVLFNRISTMIKNVRWLYSKLGTTDISSIGGGTVTGAISSLNSKTTGAFIRTSYTTEYTIGANSGLNLAANAFGISTPTGYAPVAIAQFTSGNTRVYVRAVNCTSTGTTGVLYMQNTTTESITSTAGVTILYVKTSLI